MSNPHALLGWMPEWAKELIILGAVVLFLGVLVYLFIDWYFDPRNKRSIARASFNLIVNQSKYGSRLVGTQKQPQFGDEIHRGGDAA